MTAARKVSLEEIEQFILNNKNEINEDRIFVRKYKPENPTKNWTSYLDVARTYEKYKINPKLLVTANLTSAVADIRRHFDELEREIDDVLKKEALTGIVTDPTKTKIDYMFAAQSKFCLSIKISNPEKVQFMLTLTGAVYNNQRLPVEQRKDNAAIVNDVLLIKLKEELNSYKRIRMAEGESFRTRFGMFFDLSKYFSKKDKLDTADKIINRLENKKDIEDFTDKELRALKDGRLGKILEKYQQLGFPIDTYKANQGDAHIVEMHMRQA